MSIFERFRTAFKVLIMTLTMDKVITIGFIALGILFVWTVLSLLFNIQLKTKKQLITIMEFLSKEKVNKENYSVFTALWTKLPVGFKRGWKRYEQKKEGIASDYLSQNECVDLPMFGGVAKQNRSLMRSAICFFSISLTIFSISIIGLYTPQDAVEVGLTTKLLVDALLVPLVFLCLYMITYFVYTAIRHNEYRVLVDTFHDFVDTLDDKVDIKDIFDDNTTMISLVSNIYNNASAIKIKEKKEKQTNRNKIDIGELSKEGKGLVVSENGILGEKDNKDENNILKGVESSHLSIEAEGLEKANGSNKTLIIKNEAEFSEKIDEVNDLLVVLKQEKDVEKKKELENRINAMMKALTDYKQKAKSKKNGVK